MKIRNINWFNHYSQKTKLVLDAKDVLKRFTIAKTKIVRQRADNLLIVLKKRLFLPHRPQLS